MAKKLKKSKESPVLFGPHLDYSEAIKRRADYLNTLGAAYLARLPFLDNQTVLERLWESTNLREERGDALQDWEESFLDGWIPYAPSSNGSLYYSLRRAEISCDAHLRNLLEVSEGRERDYLPFAAVAEKDVVREWAGLLS